jgi:hypothetical protein
MFLTSSRGRHHARSPRAGAALPAVIVGVCVLAIAVIILTTAWGGSSSHPKSAQPRPTVVPPVRDTTMTPQTQVFLAEIRRKGITLYALDTQQAVLVATAVCELNRRERKDRVSLPTLGVTVSRMVPRLARIQAAELVDDAVKYYCPGR